jgi:two-component system KDP operon response regulator KdpE
MKLLVIEDDPEIQEIISIYLRMSWPDAKVISSLKGKGGVELSGSEKPDIIILDLGLPDISGFDVLKEIRSFSRVPIIILTVKGEEHNRVKGLELGADDYMVKPFSPAELLARIRAVLRRTEGLLFEGEPLNFGELMIDPGPRKVILRGKEVKLSPTEYNLFYLLAVNEGRVLTGQLLLERVWGQEYLDFPDYLTTYILRLRSKLEEDPQHPKLILTKKGVGYMFAKPG